MILLSVTHMLYANQVYRGVGRCELFFVKPEWKSMNSINGIAYYLNKCTPYQTHYRVTDDNFLLGRQRTGALCVQHSPTAAALSTNTAFE